MGDPSNDQNVAERRGWVDAAKHLVAANGLLPTPPAIRREFDPTDADVNKALDNHSGSHSPAPKSLTVTRDVKLSRTFGSLPGTIDRVGDWRGA
jgi:hypothetical protein